MCLPPACFETGFGFVSGFEEGYLVEKWKEQSRFEELVARIIVTLPIF